VAYVAGVAVNGPIHGELVAEAHTLPLRQMRTLVNEGIGESSSHIKVRIRVIVTKRKACMWRSFKQLSELLHNRSEEKSLPGAAPARLLARAPHNTYL
jgi:hypothetical protein